MKTKKDKNDSYRLMLEKIVDVYNDGMQGKYREYEIGHLWRL